MLRLKLDNELQSRWAEGHVAASVLWDDFARYVYLPRLRDQEVLMTTIENGPGSLTWQAEGFAVAVGVDGSTGRYLGLAAGSHPGPISPTALVVRPEFAIGQQEAEEDERSGKQGSDGSEQEAGPRRVDGPPVDAPRAVPAVFRGTVFLDSARPVKHFGEISKEVLDHLASQVGADLEVRLEIVARKPDGFPDHAVRTVTENARTLRFDPTAGFSEE